MEVSDRHEEHGYVSSNRSTNTCTSETKKSQSVCKETIKEVIPAKKKLKSMNGGTVSDGIKELFKKIKKTKTITHKIE